MAGRIRTLKPELLDDEKIVAMEHDVFRAFVGAILLADDHGGLRAHPNYLEKEIFKGCAPTTSMVEIIAKLEHLGCLMTYVVREQRYARLVNWTLHQKIDRPSKPRVPLISDAEAVGIFECSQHLAGCLKTLATDLRPPTSDLRSPITIGGSELKPSDPAPREQLALVPVDGPAKPSLLFDCVGYPKTWVLTDRRLSDLERDYDGAPVDVRLEAIKARNWLRVNPKRRKTYAGTERFLVAWINRETDNPRGRRSQRFQTDAQRGAEAAEIERLKGDEGTRDG